MRRRIAAIIVCLILVAGLAIAGLVTCSPAPTTSSSTCTDAQIEQAIQSLQSCAPGAHQAAAGTLVARGAEAVPALIQALEHPNPYVRSAAQPPSYWVR